MEFKFLSQWRSWTKRDINSVEGTISSDMAYGGVAPNQRLRVKTNPTPIGSLLNNRGERLSVITTDIDGAARAQPVNRLTSAPTNSTVVSMSRTSKQQPW
ncbi:MAG: hypothetical protein IPI29_08020 [Ignavibacteria bacterium]|nr:hypothetical protein [Ignavibacteria bacterium]